MPALTVRMASDLTSGAELMRSPHLPWFCAPLKSCLNAAHSKAPMHLWLQSLPPEVFHYL